ncbi:Transposon Tf2-9 polyprotein [Trichinella patagoniensis]|uniref:Transposon Tf2-9 polyprotein n=1 Tax=Trichinella patagoniensis TaxID=990121 RepID=A0A0V0Z2B3_9BILA|nr:Transposon Tf2-9 polyprotein [Trichinella patagoniensis]
MGVSSCDIAADSRSRKGLSRRWCREPSETKSYSQCTTVGTQVTWLSGGRWHESGHSCGISSAACWHGHSCAAGKDPRGNRCVLVLMDYFTKWTAVFSLANMEARTVAKVLDEEYIAYFGAPDYLLCDQGRSFEASVVLQICRLFDIKTPTFPYHPQRNGQAERFNRTLLGMLSILVNGNSGYWDNMLPFVMLAYNSSVHESTVVTPAIAMLGRDLRLPLYVQIENPPGREDQGLPDNIRGTRERIDRVHDLAMDHMKTQQRRQKCLHDRHAKE